MASPTVTFGGVVLTDIVNLGEIVVSNLPRQVNLQELPGRDGALLTSAPLSPLTIQMTATHLSTDPVERFNALRELNAALTVRNSDWSKSGTVVRPLSCDQWMVDTTFTWRGNDMVEHEKGGLEFVYVNAVAEGADLTRYVNAEAFPITFTVPEPYFYGPMYELPADPEVAYYDPDAWVQSWQLTYPGNIDALPIIEVETDEDINTLEYRITIKTFSYSGEVVDHFVIEQEEWPTLGYGDHGYIDSSTQTAYVVDPGTRRRLTITPNIESDWPTIKPRINDGFWHNYWEVNVECKNLAINETNMKPYSLKFQPRWC